MSELSSRSIQDILSASVEALKGGAFHDFSMRRFMKRGAGILDAITISFRDQASDPQRTPDPPLDGFLRQEGSQGGTAKLRPI